MDFNKTVGNKIYSLRKEKDMSRVELGKKVNLHETTIKKYEDGKIKSLGTDKLEEFASALGTTINYLMAWDDDKLLVKEELDNVYFSFAKEAQQNEIDPEDIKLAIETIKRLRNK